MIRPDVRVLTDIVDVDHFVALLQAELADLDYDICRNAMHTHDIDLQNEFIRIGIFKTARYGTTDEEIVIGLVIEVKDAKDGRYHLMYDDYSLYDPDMVAHIIERIRNIHRLIKEPIPRCDTQQHTRNVHGLRMLIKGPHSV